MSLAALAAPAAPLPAWQAVAVLVPALTALAGAVIARRRRSAADAWRTARLATGIMLGSAIANAVVAAKSGARSSTWLRIDVVTLVMALLVGFLAVIITRYAATYLAGDARERFAIGRLLTTLAMVEVVLVANHLVVLAAAWTATSVALHGLLRYYPDRPAAVAAAHKKFVLARAADACLVGAIVAFATTLDTMRIDRIVAAATTGGSVPAGARLGVVLVALAAVLKCAQLPFHGWLIQVMEAPTPVSALLHGGIVNLGGFVLLRFAPLVDRTIEARVVLVAFGTLTAVVAALVMTTRVSVKVGLAWSTCAQMGFMVLQCGLGAWQMALVHLVAHSLYKAHAFLSAGETVHRTQLRMLGTRRTALAPATVASAAVTATALTAIAAIAVAASPFSLGASPVTWVLGAIVAAALVPMLVAAFDAPTPKTAARAIVSAGAVAAAYFVLHRLADALVPHGTPPPVVLLVLVGAAFGAAFTVQVGVALRPTSRWIAALHPWFYCGLSLDQTFSRWVFRAWPPPAVAAQPSTPLPVPSGHVIVAPTTLTPSPQRHATVLPILDPILDGSAA